MLECEPLVYLSACDWTIENQNKSTSFSIGHTKENVVDVIYELCTNNQKLRLV